MSQPSPRQFFTALDERKRNILMVLALGLLTFALFAPAIRFQFINYDDDLYVYANPHVLGGLNLPDVAYALRTVDVGNWMPLTWLSLQLDASLYGNWPDGFHFTSIALHCGSVALLFLALQRMTKCYWRSALAAALFAVHPLRQESVLWIAERKGTLSTFFWLLGLLAYARYAEQRTIRRYVLVALCLILGLAAKSMLVTFPLALLLLDFWPLGRMGVSWSDVRTRLRPLLIEKLPLVLICVVMVGITYWAQNRAGAVGDSPATLLAKVSRVLNDYFFYLKKTLWPAGLAIPYPPQSSSLLQTGLAAGIITVLSFVAVRRCRSLPWLTVGWFWFLGTLVPVIGLLQISHTFVADRYSYVPFIGLALVFAWGMGALAERSTALRQAAIFLAVVVCILAAATNHFTLTRWSDSITLFTDSVAKAPHHVSCINLTLALTERGDYAAAQRYGDQAVALNPNSADAYCARGLARNGLKQYSLAIEDFSRSLKLKPNLAQVWNNRGNVYVNQGDLTAARADYTRAIELQPNFTEAWNNRAFVQFSQSNYPAAIADCTRAIAINPASSRAYNNRGNIFSGMQDYQRAVDDYSRAIELDPSFATAYDNRATAYLGLKAYAKARADLKTCQALGGQPNPNTQRALNAAP